MKHLVLAVTLMLVYNISMACQTTKVFAPDGSVTICKICPTTIICF